MKRVFSFILAFSLVLGINVSAVDVFVNDNMINFDTAPKIVFDRTMVPMRAVFEAMGASVSWDEVTQTVIGRKKNISVSTTIGTDIVYKNGEAIKMDCSSFIENDRTYVPIRFIAQCFGALVSWSEELLRVDVAYATEDDVAVHFIDVGQGDAEFIELPGDRTMLIDSGEYEYGERVCNYINGLGYDTIDYLVATHPHSDHIGCMDDVFSNFKIKNVYMPNAVSNSKTFERFLSAIEAEDCSTYEAKAGVEILSEGDLQIKILSPVKASYEDLNNYSAVVKLTYGEADYLFTGDAEELVERSILNSDIDAEVLKVGHHGSSTSSSEAFVRAVSPDYAVISCGESNSYGHPHYETLEIFDEYGIDVFRTDLDGTIVISTDGKNIFTEDGIKKAGTNIDSVYCASCGTDCGGECTYEEVQKETQVVYITKTGEKYHIYGCRYLNDLIKTTLESALQSGLTPCSVCNP